MRVRSNVLRTCELMPSVNSKSRCRTAHFYILIINHSKCGMFQRFMVGISCACVECQLQLANMSCSVVCTDASRIDKYKNAELFA